MPFTNEDLEEWFKSFDTDGSGKIDVHELRILVQSFFEWQNIEFDNAKVDADVGVRCVHKSLRNVRVQAQKQHFMIGFVINMTFRTNNYLLYQSITGVDLINRL